MRRTKFTAAVAVLAISGLALAGCSSDAPESSAGGGEEGPLKVLVFGGIGAEGILANNATTSVTAAEASVAGVNAAGGIMGRQVEIQVVDDTADPTVAVTKLREILADGEKPVAVMNSGPSTVADAIIPILTQNEILSFNIGPTSTSADASVNPYNFDLSPSVPDYIAAFVLEIEKRKYEKIAVLHGSSAYGELFGSLTESGFTDAGYTVTGNVGYDNAALDMTPQLEALKETNPDVLVLESYGAPLGYVLQGLEKLGWDIPVMGNNSVSATGLIAVEPPTGVLGTDQVKNLTMQVFLSTKYDASNTKLVEAVDLMAATGPIMSSLILAYNFDAMWLVKAAAESAGALDAKSLADALVDPAVQSSAQTIILTKYNFQKDVHSPHSDPSEFAFISPGPLVNGQFQ